ncbi:MAG: sulfurtransferase [Gammaproteobacteria bacterium]|nr:sulfurtransferase [Gammaproteobacteria bacterium]
MLVTTDWLAKNSSNKNLVLIDMSDGMQYSRFHLPGARHLPYSSINIRTKTGISLSAGNTRIAQILGLIGIKASDHIVIYDDMGGLHAARLFWELEKLGHKNVSLLDGGLVKWILEGRKVTSLSPSYTKTQYSAKTPSLNNLASMEQISQASRDNKALLLDVRSKEEYQGHPKHKRSGHIPGAIWWEWEQAVNFDRKFTLKSEQELENSLSHVGIKNKQQPVIVYCRSGHRAAHTYFSLRRSGFSDVKLFDGSMAEYELHKQHPVKKGLIP